MFRYSPTTPRTTKYILLSLILIGFALRLFKLAEQSLWADEFFSAYVTSLAPLNMLGIIIRDRVHPPLYYMLLMCWQWLGNTPFLVRFLSVIFGVWTIPSTFILGKSIMGSRVGLLSAFLITISPLHIWYSQEARMQTLFVLTTILTHFFLVQIITHNRKWDWIGYTLFLLASITSHYFALLILPLHFILFAYYARPLFKEWFKKMILIGMIYSIWGLLLGFTGGMQGANIEWIRPINWYDFIFTLVTFTAGRTIIPFSPLSYVNLLIILGGLISAYHLYLHSTKSTVIATKQKRPSQVTMIMLWLWFIVPLTVIWFISLDIIGFPMSFYMDRYLIISMPPLLILGSIGFAHITKDHKYSLGIIVTLLLFFSTISLHNMYNNNAFKRDDWKGAYTTLSTLYESTDLLLIPPQAGAIGGYRYYANDDLNTQEFNKETFSTTMPQIENQYQRLWLVTGRDVIDPHGFPQMRNKTLSDSRNVYQQLLDSNYVFINEWQYNGVRLSLYNLQETPN